MFSVIIPLYNKENNISDTIMSVLNQTFSDFEIIVVNDGSTDNSVNVVQAIVDPRIRIINQINSGVSSARNRGIEEANNNWIALLDGDDLWEPEKLNEQANLLLKNPEACWCFAAYKIVSPKRSWIVNYKNEDVIPDAIDAIVNGARIHTSSIVIKKSVFSDRRFLFNTKYSNSEDREVWYKLACLYPMVCYINKPLSSYNAEIQGSLTSGTYGKNNLLFLTMKQRLEEITNSISNIRKYKLLKFIKAFNKKAIYNKWAVLSIDNFNKFPLETQFNFLQIFFLKKSASFPLILKKVILKLFL